MTPIERNARKVLDMAGKGASGALSWQLSTLGSVFDGASTTFSSASRGVNVLEGLLTSNELVEEQANRLGRAAMVDDPASEPSPFDINTDDPPGDDSLHEEPEVALGEEVEHIRKMAEKAQNKGGHQGQRQANDRRQTEVETETAQVDLRRSVEAAEQALETAESAKQQATMAAAEQDSTASRSKSASSIHSGTEQPAPQQKPNRKRTTAESNVVPFGAEAAAAALRTSAEAAAVGNAWDTPVGNNRAEAKPEIGAENYPSAADVKTERYFNAEGFEKMEPEQKAQVTKSMLDFESSNAAQTESPEGAAAEQLHERALQIEQQRAAEQAALDAFKEQAAAAASAAGSTSSDGFSASTNQGPQRAGGQASQPSFESAGSSLPASAGQRAAAESPAGGLRGLAAKAGGGIATEASNASNYSSQSAATGGAEQANLASDAASSAANGAAQSAASMAAILEDEARRAGVDIDEVSN